MSTACTAGQACRCTDIEWDPDTVRVERYEIDRQLLPSDPWVPVGTLPELPNDDGGLDPPFHGWNVLRAPTVPVEGTLYLYRIRGCNSVGCSAWVTIYDQGFPVACFDGGAEVRCYTGAPCRVPGRGCQ